MAYFAECPLCLAALSSWRYGLLLRDYSGFRCVKDLLSEIPATTILT